jgi:hypothetical protein
VRSMYQLDLLCDLINHTIVKLDPRRSSFSEIIWRLSRLRDRGRITPGQRPFFYRLPISGNDYHNEFKLYPIEDFQAVFSHNVYVLVDKPGPGRVIIESETRKLSFGNVWMPKHTLIFKGAFLSSPLLLLALTSSQTSSAHWSGKGPLGWTPKSPRTYASGIPSTLREPKCFLLPWLPVALPRRLATANWTLQQVLT